MVERHGRESANDPTATPDPYILGRANDPLGGDMNEQELREELLDRLRHALMYATESRRLVLETFAAAGSGSRCPGEVHRLLGLRRARLLLRPLA